MPKKPKPVPGPREAEPKEGLEPRAAAPGFIEATYVRGKSGAGDRIALAVSDINVIRARTVQEGDPPSVSLDRVRNAGEVFHGTYEQFLDAITKAEPRVWVLSTPIRTSVARYVPLESPDPFT